MSTIKTITQYGSQEMSLLFLNDYQLYRTMTMAIHDNVSFEEFKEDVIDEHFEYTTEQLESMEETYNNEKAEL